MEEEKVVSSFKVKTDAELNLFGEEYYFGAKAKNVSVVKENNDGTLTNVNLQSYLEELKNKLSWEDI